MNYTNVTVQKEANVYFSGAVTSRTILLADGSRKTLGVMLPGEYTFGTSENEIMEILRGRLAVRLQDQDQWQEYCGPDATFDVPANTSFDVRVLDLVDYCCSYV